MSSVAGAVSEAPARYLTEGGLARTSGPSPSSPDSRALRRSPLRTSSRRRSWISGFLLFCLLPGGAKAQAPREYVLEVFDRLGGLDAGPGLEFSGAMLSVARAQDGGTLVLDPLHSVVVHVPPDGSVHSFGGPGRGPGELRAPVAMLVQDDGTIVIASAFAGRYTVYEADGRFRGTKSRPIRATVKNQFALGAAGAGRLIDQAPLPEGGVDIVAVEEGRSTSLLRIDFPSLPPGVDALAPIQPGSDWARVAQAFLPFPVWALAADGTVWIADATTHTLRRHSLDGSILSEVGLAHELTGFSTEESRAIDRGLHEVGLSRNQVSLKRRSAVVIIPNRVDSSVLVQRPGEFSRPSGVLDHYSSEGEWLGVLRVDVPVSATAVHYFSRDTVYLVTSDRLDVPTIQLGVLSDRGASPGR